MRVNFPNRGRGDFSSPPPPRRFENSNENKLFVGNLTWGVDSDMLREVFSQYGTVLEARVVNDRETARSRGFGFVTMASEEETTEALNKLDGAVMDSHFLKNITEHSFALCLVFSFSDLFLFYIFIVLDVKMAILFRHRSM